LTGFADFFAATTFGFTWALGAGLRVFGSGDFLEDPFDGLDLDAIGEQI